MSDLNVDFFISLDGSAFGEGWPAYFGLDGPGMFAWVNEQTDRDHTMVMGANTYREMAEIVAGGDDPTFARMNELPKIVFSSTIRPPLTWPNTRLVADDAVTTVRQLKEESTTPLRTIGSLSLSRSLLTAGVVDRLRLMIFPLILGTTGRQRIFDGLPDLDLTLVNSKTYDDRLQLLEYLPALH